MQHSKLDNVIAEQPKNNNTNTLEVGTGAIEYLFSPAPDFVNLLIVPVFRWDLKLPIIPVFRLDP